MESENKDLTTEQEEYVQIIVRQTDYDYNKSKSKLIEFNFDYESVIKDFMGIKKKDNVCNTSNQQRYKMIRTAMDTQIKNYEKKNIN
tara:strand:+ start:319 stop:579 length:261 start_codon:yes stop_codon:yes gene_type:complete